MVIVMTMFAYVTLDFQEQIAQKKKLVQIIVQETVFVKKDLNAIAIKDSVVLIAQLNNFELIELKKLLSYILN